MLDEVDLHTFVCSAIEEKSGGGGESGRLEKLREKTYWDLHVTYANRVYTLKIPSLQVDVGVKRWIITPCFLDEKIEKPHS